MSRTHRIPFGRHTAGAILRFLIWLMLRIHVHGAENIPANGAGIVYYNHIHWLDPVLICGKLRRYAVPLTKIEASRWPLVGLLLRWYHVIFITRGVVDRAALKATWEVLAAGDISVIAPEGTRSLTGKLQTAKEGLAFVRAGRLRMHGSSPARSPARRSSAGTSPWSIAQSFTSPTVRPSSTGGRASRPGRSMCRKAAPAANCCAR